MQWTFSSHNRACSRKCLRPGVNSKRFQSIFNQCRQTVSWYYADVASCDALNQTGWADQNPLGKQDFVGTQFSLQPRMAWFCSNKLQSVERRRNSAMDCLVLLRSFTMETLHCQPGFTVSQYCQYLDSVCCHRTPTFACCSHAVIVAAPPDQVRPAGAAGLHPSSAQLGTFVRGITMIDSIANIHNPPHHPAPTAPKPVIVPASQGNTSTVFSSPLGSVLCEV